MKRNTLLLIGCFAALVLTPIAQANLITNPSFEQPTHARNDGTNPDDWTVIEGSTGNNTDRQVRTRDQNSFEGTMSLQLGAGNSVHDGQLWQAVATDIGQLYQFTIHSRSVTPAANQNFQVDLRDGTGIGGSVLDTLGSAGTLTAAYQSFTTTFTASSAFTTIHISDVSTAAAADSNDVFLDGLSLLAIPEPGTSALMLFGGVLCLGLRRRWVC